MHHGSDIQRAVFEAQSTQAKVRSLKRVLYTDFIDDHILQTLSVYYHYHIVISLDLCLLMDWDVVLGNHLLTSLDPSFQYKLAGDCFLLLHKQVGLDVALLREHVRVTLRFKSLPGIDE